MTQFYSRNDTTFQGDSIFTIPFSYIKQEDINIFVNDELIKDWLWLNETQVSITKELTLGDLISIRRQTPIDEKIVDYQNMSMVLDDNNLNLSQDQNIYSIQELYDNNEQFKINTNETLATDKVELENIIETNRQELLDIQTNFENETNIKFDDYKTELNTKIETVAEAADKINELEEVVTVATEAAQTVTQANIDMQNKLDEVTQSIEEANSGFQESQSLMQEMLEEARNTVDSRANIDLSNLSPEGQAKLDSYVKKSGDTMTGNLRFQQAEQMFMPFNRTDIETGSTGSARRNVGGYIAQANGTDIALIQGYVDTNGESGLQLITRKPDNSVWGAAINLFTDVDGNSYFDFPKCTTKATTVSSAAYNKVAVIVQNYVNGTSWYRVWSDGWIEQGGLVASNVSITVTFPKPFTTQVYHANRCNINNHSGAESSRFEFSVSDVTLTGMFIRTTSWSGPSYWYACGY